MDSKWISRISWGLVIVWMFVIFKFSSQVAQDSDGLSRSITELTYKVLNGFFRDMEISMKEMNHYIRKVAHFKVYTALGLLVLNGFRRSNLKDTKYYFFTIAICILYAISDELHQSFVPGRGPSSFDVLIDSSGAIVGVIIYVLAQKIKNARHKLYRY